ncbi:hypothetical protein GH714_013652 [Hevea brasiliensis]|uniref:Integrase zinc-binding domain-containing protein n=1 Tax=Hevea brasiliensis TaxID=3981 RepID=A0A6A6NGX1_HEVBR|nr:hypothetical protein GH714_013652 [Hevea brasiliensis]
MLHHRDHSGALRTYERLAANVYWKGVMKMIQLFVAKCPTCHQQKYQTLSPGGLLQPLPIPQQGLKHPFTARTVAALFTKEIVHLHGMGIDTERSSEKHFNGSRPLRVYARRVKKKGKVTGDIKGNLMQLEGHNKLGRVGSQDIKQIEYFSNKKRVRG